MRIAVSSSGQDLNSEIDPRFGRCSYFLIIETSDLSFEVHRNASATLSGGAGIQAAQLVGSLGAEAVITGNCGPNAVQALSAAGLKLYLGQSGSVEAVVKKFIDGKLSPSHEPNTAEFSGMGMQSPGFKFQPGTGRRMGGGRSMGGGRGMGGSRGQGGGRGMGAGQGMNRSPGK